MPPPDLQQIAELYYKDLFKFAWSLSGNESDAQDLTQETLLIFAKKGSSLKDPSKAKSWLFTSLYREFLHHRRHSLRFTTMPEELAEGVDELVPSSAWVSASQGHEESAAPHDEVDAQVVLSAVQRMDENLRLPLTLFYLKNFKYREIADVLKIPIGTVMSRLARAKAQLRADLGITPNPVPAL